MSTTSTNSAPVSKSVNMVHRLKAPFRFARRQVRKVGQAFESVAFRFAGINRLTAALYYAFVNGAFGREQVATIAGRRRYQDELLNPSDNCALLRRNVHRLEKGLLMRPRRPVFALDYLDETVDIYVRLVESLGEQYQEEGDTVVRWAHNVLAEYFAVTSEHPKSDRARRRFLDSRQLVPGDRRLVPYQRNLGEELGVSYESMLALAHRRRSVRWFLDKPVSRDLIDRAVMVAAQSPSACNRQPFMFRIIDDPELVRQVAAVPMGTPGFAHNIPVMVVVVGQLRNYPFERDRHVIYIDGSLAAMSFIYALEVQGIGSCCINWPDVESLEKRMSELLKLEKDERPIMCLALGYPDPEGLVAYSQKKPLSQMRSYNM